MLSFLSSNQLEPVRSSFRISVSFYPIANYQSLINDAGNASPVDQVFWNFLTDTESPVSLSSTQLDAISQAMTSVDPTESTTGDAFCGQLNSLNQILRSGIITGQFNPSSAQF